MGDDNGAPEDRQDWLKKELLRMFSTTNDEEAVNKAPDTRPGPEEQADRNLTLENKLHELLTLYFAVDGLTCIRQKRQDSFQLPLQVFLRMLRRETPEKIASELGCNRATVYRHRNSILFVVGFFDVFNVELDTRLKNQVEERQITQITFTVFQRIRIGWDRKKIIRQLEEKAEVIDRAYITLRRESAKIWEELKDMMEHDPERLVRLIEAQRRIKS
jgi:hypothetical protein